MNATQNQTVTVTVKHATSRPRTVWVEPIGWEPDVSQFGPAAIWDGAVWGDESEGADELAGLAATLDDLGAIGAKEGDQFEVLLFCLFWLGNDRYLGEVQAR
jgi:hypothetical protein